MNTEKRIIIGFCILLVLLGVAFFKFSFSSNIDIESIVNDGDDDNILEDNYIYFYSPFSNENLIAILKGSIYETGENISIYGVCFRSSNETNEEFVDANVSIKIFRGNGSTLVDNNMSTLSLGHYVYHWVVPDIQETFLTEMNCTYGDKYATAWGEVQNPLWANRIKNISVNINATINATVKYGLVLSMLSFPEEIGKFDNFTSYLSYSLTDGTTGLTMDVLNVSILYKNNTILTENTVSDLQLHRNIYKFEYDLNNTEINDYYLRIYGKYQNAALLSTGYFKVVEQNDTSVKWSTSVAGERIYNTPVNFVTKITSTHNVSGIDCNIVTNFWGLKSMNRNILSRAFQYNNVLNESNKIFTWSVSCYES